MKKLSLITVVMTTMIIMAYGNCFAEIKAFGYGKIIKTANEIKTPDGIKCLTLLFDSGRYTKAVKPCQS